MSESQTTVPQDLWPDIERSIRMLVHLMLPRGRSYPLIEEFLDAHEYGLALEQLAGEVSAP